MEEYDKKAYPRNASDKWKYTIFDQMLTPEESS